MDVQPQTYPHSSNHNRVDAIRPHRHAHQVTMKTKHTHSTRPSERGGILVTAIIFCALVGLVLVAYLSMLRSQHKFTFRSQVWNDCVPLCEAGIEEALAHVNYSGTIGTNFGLNGWLYSANAYRKELSLNGGTVKVAISNDMPPTIFVNGSLKAPLSSANLTRVIRVGTRLNQRFAYAVLSRGNITCNSSGARVDSYDSSNPLKSTLGQYDPLKAGDQATLATTAKMPNSIDIGNLKLYGYAGTGPGGTVGINNGNVGSTLFNNNPLNSGKIEGGHSANDVNVYIPDPTLPTMFASGTAPAGGVIGGTNYAYILPAGDWTLSSLNLGTGQRMIVTGNARLLVNGSTSINGSADIDVAPGGNLEFYTTGNADIKGNVNNPGAPKDFNMIGLKGCTSISYSGGASYVGTVNAPQADVIITGGSALYGAIIAKTAKVGGGLSFHYDEALKGNPREARFLVTSYQEL